jgi:hypothetical protein
VIGRLTLERLWKLTVIFCPNALKVQGCWSLSLQHRESTKVMQDIWDDAFWIKIMHTSAVGRNRLSILG